MELLFFRMEANSDSAKICILPYGQQGPQTIGSKKTEKMNVCQSGQNEFIPSVSTVDASAGVGVEGKALDIGRQTLSTKLLRAERDAQ